MFRSICSFVLMLSLLLIHSCNSPTSVTDFTEQGESYTPLERGIVKQYFSNSDNSYQSSKILGKATREDGQEVYITENKIDMPSTSNLINTSYHFIKDGFLYATSLVKKDIYDNSYYTARVAKVAPKDGDSWHIQDSAELSFTAKYIGKMTTPAGVFQDVFNYQYYDTMMSDTAKLYYAKGIGHIGSLTSSGLMIVNYVKIGDKEYGQLVRAE